MLQQGLNELGVENVRSSTYLVARGLGMLPLDPRDYVGECLESSKAWDKGVIFMLFARREIPR